MSKESIDWRSSCITYIRIRTVLLSVSTYASSVLVPASASISVCISVRISIRIFIRSMHLHLHPPLTTLKLVSNCWRWSIFQMKFFRYSVIPFSSSVLLSQSRRKTLKKKNTKEGAIITKQQKFPNV